jgi:hypothetical protein
LHAAADGLIGAAKGIHDFVARLDPHDVDFGDLAARRCGQLGCGRDPDVSTPRKKAAGSRRASRFLSLSRNSNAPLDG